MKFRLQCDVADCNEEEEVDIKLSKATEARIRSFVKDHGERHTLIST